MEQQQFQTLMIDQFRIVHEELRDIKSDVRDIRKDVRQLEGQMSEVIQSTNTVKIRFSMMWGVMSLLIAIVASGITEIFAH